MGSIFIHAGLAAGVALAAIPVVLHLFMKPTPKHIVFPALRLIRERQKKSKKTLKIKNWLLLLARMALIALMALALARPRVNAKVKAGSEVETAIVFVFDTSLSMGYTERDKTRLDLAKERAAEILKRAHSGSQVYVIDTADAALPPPLSPASAGTRIESLEIRPANRPLNQALGPAYEAATASDKPRREVYVFTDLARSSWRTDQPIAGLDKATKPDSGVNTFIIRLAAEGRYDVGIVSAEPTNGLASQDEPVPIRARIRSVGKAAERSVEFYVDGQKRDQKVVQAPADAEVDVPTFNPRLDPGLHRVEIRLTGERDPLEFDDRYFMTFDVQPSMKVLVVSDLIDDADWVSNALDPVANQGKPGVARPFQVERVLTASLPTTGFGRPLRDYAAVFLLDVGQPGEGHWRELTDYVKQGGGLVIGVGDRVWSNREAYNASGRELLPATLEAVKVHEDFSFGRPDLTNTLFTQNTRELLSELSRIPVYKTMTVSPTQDARTLLSYQDETPALVERVVQGGSAPGRVLLWTTALYRVPETTKTWNEFPLEWPFLQLMGQTVPYLAGTAGRRLVVEAGETVTLPVDAAKGFTDFSAQPPGSGAEPIGLNPPSAGGPLVIPALTINSPGHDPVGHWTIAASKPGGGASTLGFSVNSPTSEAQLSLMEPKDLDGLFGKDHYKLADDPTSLKRVQEEVTFGREIFPWLMMLILLIVTAENALANMFYRDRTGTRPASPLPAGA